MYNRLISLEKISKDQHVLLLGPRQTGKSTFLKTWIPQALCIDLLDSREFLMLSQNPNLLEERVRAYVAQQTMEKNFVIIDEIQKLPLLLDEAQRLMPLFPSVRFIFTGSSARKLRRSGTNLLGGRAAKSHMFPLVSKELESWPEKKHNISDLLLKGGLPPVLQAEDFETVLESYVGVYLQEEIAAEGIVRSLPNFARFLQAASLMNGEQINFSAVASDATLPARTVQEYFQILQDTLVGELLEPYRTVQKRKSVSSPKFYFFDVGVANILRGVSSVQPKTSEFGKQLEHLVYCELKAALEYLPIKGTMSYWRERTSGYEVDFIVAKRSGDLIAIEVKGTSSVTEKDLRGLRAFEETQTTKGKIKKICVSGENHMRITEDGIQIIPYEVFFKQLWDGKIL